MKEETYPLRNRSVLYRPPISICRGHRGMKEQCQYSEKGSIIRIKKKKKQVRLSWTQRHAYNNVTELLLNPFEETIVLTHLTAIQQHSTPSTDNCDQTDLTLPRCLDGKDQEKADERL